MECFGSGSAFSPFSEGLAPFRARWIISLMQAAAPAPTRGFLPIRVRRFSASTTPADDRQGQGPDKGRCTWGGGGQSRNFRCRAVGSTA